MKLTGGTWFKVWAGIGLSLILVLVALVALGATNRPATAAQPAAVQSPAGATANKISEALRAAFKNSSNGKVRYLAVLTTQADTANTITDWNAKGQYVLDALRNVANTTQPPVAAALRSLKTNGTVESFKSYYIINAFQVRGTLASADALAALPSIARLDEFPLVTLDEEVSSPADSAPNAIEWNVNIIRAPQAWALGYTGVGVTVGSLDTGARYMHQAIVGKYRGNLGGGNFDHNYNWWPAIGSSLFPVDSGGGDANHGSHTIGTILGDDGAGNQIGVAPGAKWISSNGIASPAGDADIIEAGQWMLAPYDLAGQNPDPSKRPQVVSNSWGYGGYSFSCTTATFFHTVVQSWSAAGIFPSYSSGNGGTSGNRIPGSYPETFETGSINIAGNISSFSSRGPSCYDGSVEPQVVAGGENVRSVDGAGDTGYKFLSGTSMSQPAVAGAVAILKQANPNLTVAQTWFILTSTAVFSPNWGTRPNSDYGWGLVQLDAAVQAALQLGGTPTPTVTGTPPTATRTATRTNTVPPSNTPTPQPTACAVSSYVSTDVPRTICDLCTITSTLTIPAGAGTISDLDLTGLSAAHTYINDMIVSLTSPNNTTVVLIAQICGSEDNFTNITLDDQAAQPIGSSCPPTAGGSFQPGNLLSAFNGQAASGVWMLTISDNAAQDTGNLTAWGLRVSRSGGCGTDTPTPGTTAVASPTQATTSTATPAVTMTPCAVTFQDVPSGSTFYDYVRCLACRGIVGGYPCGGPGEPCPGSFFRPNNNVTRGQVSKIVSESAAFADPVPSTQQTFQDVPSGGTFWLWVERIASRGIIAGYPCGSVGEPCVAPGNKPYFRPNNNVTRGQLSKIVSGAAGWTETPIGQTFADVAPTSTFYQWIERMSSRGIIGGYPCGSTGEPCVAPGNKPYFRPNNNATRGQMSKIAASAFYPGCSTPARR